MEQELQSHQPEAVRVPEEKNPKQVNDKSAAAACEMEELKEPVCLNKEKTKRTTKEKRLKGMTTKTCNSYKQRLKKTKLRS